MVRRRSPQSGKVLDPQWRHQRAMKAGLAARASYGRRRAAAAAGFRTKAAAYQAGYRRGYQAAMAWWRRKYLREGRRKVAE